MTHAEMILGDEVVLHHKNLSLRCYYCIPGNEFPFNRRKNRGGLKDHYLFTN
jgi:hypothetical protein